MQALLLLVCAVLCVSTAAQDVINLGFIFSGSGQYVTEGVQPAVRLAVETINNHDDILNGYQLNISYTRDSECDHSASQRAFLEPELSVREGPDTLALLGCGCSIATQPVAEISSYWNMIHMSYASASDVLSDRLVFPNFWRTYPAESNMAGSVLSIMKQYNWTQLKILTQDEDIFTSSEEVLNATLSANNITVVQRNPISTEINDTSILDLPDLFSPEVRVYVLNMYSRHARRVLCAAARALRGELDLEFRYEKYVWITLGWYGNDWWVREDRNDPIEGCSVADVEQFLPSALGIIGANTAENTTASTEVLMTAEAFGNRLNQLLANESLQYEHSAFHAYDAVWALAFAFEQYLNQSNRSLANYNRQGSEDVISEIGNYLHMTDFIGVSGRVEFNSVGTRVPVDPKVSKYRDLSVINNCGQPGPVSIERVTVARVSVENITSVDFQYDQCEGDNTTWPNGVPRDGSPVEEDIGVLLPLVIVYYCLAGIGILLAIICFFFNFIFRNRKIIKLISPNLNYVIIIGCITLNASIFFFVFPSQDPFWVTFACHIRLWLQSFGYFSAHGVILFKILRVFYIFNISTKSGSRKKSRIPKDWQLFIGVCLMVGVNVPILAMVALFGNYRAVRVRDEEILGVHRDAEGSIVHYYNQVCDGPLDLVWVAVLYGYILITQLVALFFAFRTRKVEIKALNDYKYIAAITYITTILLAILGIVAITLERYQNADAAVYSFILFLETAVILGLVFIPKMVILYKDPKGERIFQRSMSQAGTIIGNTSIENDKSRYLELEEHCKELEGRLAKCGQVVPTFRPRAESSLKLKSMSMSLSSMPPSSPLKSPVSATNSIFSAPSTPSHLQVAPTRAPDSPGTSDYFTGAERNSSGSGSTETPDV